jgi:hypothetical protein
MPRSKQTSLAPTSNVANHKVLNPKVAVAGPSLMQTVKEGFSFGIGSAIAHRVVGGLFGSSQPQPLPEVRPTEYKRPTEYEQCLAEHRDFGDSAAFCSYLLKPKETPTTQG